MLLQLDPGSCRPKLPLHGSAASRAIEQAALAHLPPHQLMQRAAGSIAALARALQPHARHVWLACGPGNNGGDGLLAAALGYSLTMAYWRWWVRRSWRKRQEARRQR